MKITEYEQIVELTGTEIFLVETEEGTRVMTYAQLVALIKEKHEEYMEEDIEEIGKVIVGSATAVSFDDTVDLNASNVQEAIERLAGRGGSDVSIEIETSGFGDNEKENYLLSAPGSLSMRVYTIGQIDKFLRNLDNRYALKGEATGGEGSSPVDAYTKDESDERYAFVGDSYTKIESDQRYAMLADIANKVNYEADGTVAQKDGKVLATVEYVDSKPSGSGGGSTVSVVPSLTSGTKVAEITVDGSKKTIYAPATVTDAHINDLIDAKIPEPYNDSDVRSLINGKVDKVAGKGLSTNDYTTAEKNKLASLSNYDGTALSTLINGKADKGESYTKEESDSKYALKGESGTAASLGKLVVFGDSASAGYGNVNAYNWTNKQLADGVFSEVKNYAVSGSTIGDYAVGQTARGKHSLWQIEQHIADISNADIVICCYGGNDAFSVSSGACSWIDVVVSLENLIKRLSEIGAKKIVFVNSAKNVISSGSTLDDSGWYTDFGSKLYALTCDVLGIQCINIVDGTGINRFNAYNEYIQTDYVHPTPSGCDKIGDHIVEWIRNGITIQRPSTAYIKIDAGNPYHASYTAIAYMLLAGVDVIGYFPFNGAFVRTPIAIMDTNSISFFAKTTTQEVTIKLNSNDTIAFA